MDASEQRMYETAFILLAQLLLLAQHNDTFGCNLTIHSIEEAADCTCQDIPICMKLIRRHDYHGWVTHTLKDEDLVISVPPDASRRDPIGPHEVAAWTTPEMEIRLLVGHWLPCSFFRGQPLKLCRTSIGSLKTVLGLTTENGKNVVFAWYRTAVEGIEELLVIVSYGDVEAGDRARAVVLSAVKTDGDNGPH